MERPPERRSFACEICRRIHALDELRVYNGDECCEQCHAEILAEILEEARARRQRPKSSARDHGGN
jgi:hypothetical protein